MIYQHVQHMFWKIYRNYSCQTQSTKESICRFKFEFFATTWGCPVSLEVMFRRPSTRREQGSWCSEGLRMCVPACQTRLPRQEPTSAADMKVCLAWYQIPVVSDPDRQSWPAKTRSSDTPGGYLTHPGLIECVNLQTLIERCHNEITVWITPSKLLFGMLSNTNH